MHRRPYLLIVDDTLTAQCLQRLVEPEFPSTGIVADAEVLLKAVTASQPDLILLESAMSGLNGLDAIGRLREVSPATKVLVVTMNDEPEYVSATLRAGASGYVLKWCAVSELVTAIRGILNGLSYMTPPLAERMAPTITNCKGRLRGKSLTLRQREVLQLIAQGRTAKEIANSLGLSVKTAVFHKMSIMDKLGLRTTADLTRYALDHGLLSSREESGLHLPSIKLRLASNNR